MVGWHHQLQRYEFEQALGVGDGQGSLACCSPWGHKESDTTEGLTCTELVCGTMLSKSLIQFYASGWGCGTVLRPNYGRVMAVMASPSKGLRLKLKLQYFGHLIQRTDSLEKTLMLRNIEGRWRRG